MYIQDAIIVLIMAVVNIVIMVIGAYTVYTWTSPWVAAVILAAYTAGTIYVNTVVEPMDYDE